MCPVYTTTLEASGGRVVKLFLYFLEKGNRESIGFAKNKCAPDMRDFKRNLDFKKSRS